MPNAAKKNGKKNNKRAIGYGEKLPEKGSVLDIMKAAGKHAIAISIKEK
jgi:hypothetical protein